MQPTQPLQDSSVFPRLNNITPSAPVAKGVWGRQTVAQVEQAHSMPQPVGNEPSFVCGSPCMGTNHASIEQALSFLDNIRPVEGSAPSNDLSSDTSEDDDIRSDIDSSIDDDADLVDSAQEEINNVSISAFIDPFSAKSVGTSSQEATATSSYYCTLS